MMTSENKKHKKHKKHKERKKSESDEDSTGEWVEALPPKSLDTTSNKLQRDTWMEMAPTFIPTINKKEMREREREEKEEAKKSAAIEKMRKALYVPTNKRSDTSDRSETRVGDGGASWLRKAYRRLQEQSQEEGRSMEELAVERYGSLEQLEKMLKEAEDKTRGHHRGGREDRFRRPEDRYDHDRHRQRHSEKGASSQPRWMKTDCSKEASTSESHKAQEGASRQPRWMKKDAFPAKTEKPATAIATNDRTAETGSERSKGMDEVKEEKEKVEVLSEKEMNELGAKIVKAELMGNDALAVRLKERLEACRSAAKQQEQEPRVVVLTQSTSRGLTRPLEAPASAHNDMPSKKKKQKVPTHDASGKRVCYFGDDDKYSLQQMFEREKFRTVEDDTAMYLKMAAKGRTGGDYDFDDLFVDKSSVEETDVVRQRKEFQRAIQEDKYVSAALENCYHCLDSKSMQKHLIVAMGNKSYLALPGTQSLVEGHCLIVPMPHVPAATMLDEDVWIEIQEFRRSLYKLFSARGCDTVFLESSMHLRHHPHTFLECIPLPSSDGALAPMYFKKAILESETEWSENKKLVDLSKKDIRHSVPKGLPYFSVDFGLDGGFAHVIEDERLFPKYFGKEIVGGILDLEPQMWLKPRKEKFEDQSKKVLQFTEWWKPHDCTIKETN